MVVRARLIGHKKLQWWHGRRRGRGWEGGLWWEEKKLRSTAWRRHHGASNSKKIRESCSENEGVVTFVRSCELCQTIVTAVNIGYCSHRLCMTVAASASTYLWAEGRSCTENEGVGKLLYQVFWAITHLVPLLHHVALLDHLAPCPCCVSLLALQFGGPRCVLGWRSGLRSGGGRRQVGAEQLSTTFRQQFATSNSDAALPNIPHTHLKGTGLVRVHDLVPVPIPPLTRVPYLHGFPYPCRSLSPMLFCFKVTSLDFDRTWTGQAAEFGQVQRTPLEVQWTVCWVHRNWLGLAKVCWNLLEKGGECKVHEITTDKGLGWQEWLRMNLPTI